MKVGISSRQHFGCTDHGRYRLEDVEAYLSTRHSMAKDWLESLSNERILDIGTRCFRRDIEFSEIIYWIDVL